MVDTRPLHCSSGLCRRHCRCHAFRKKEQAAEAKWNRDIGNADIVRRGTGVDTQLGVMGVPRTEGYRGRESNRIVTCSDTIHSKHHMDLIMQNLYQHGATAQALTGKAMG